MVGIERLAAVIGFGQGPPKEVTPVHWVPSLSDEFIVHVNATVLCVLPDSSDLIIAQCILVALWEEWILIGTYFWHKESIQCLSEQKIYSGTPYQHTWSLTYNSLFPILVDFIIPFNCWSPSDLLSPL